MKLVETTARNEHAASPKRPIYLVGDSFGGSLALSVAARNPNIDIILILCNPGENFGLNFFLKNYFSLIIRLIFNLATSFGSSQLQPFLPILDSLPNELHAAVPYMLSFIMGTSNSYFFHLPYF